MSSTVYSRSCASTTAGFSINSECCPVWSNNNDNNNYTFLNIFISSHAVFQAPQTLSCFVNSQRQNAFGVYVAWFPLAVCRGASLLLASCQPNLPSLLA